MVHGEVGLLGPLVEVIARSQDPEVVIVLLQQMEGTHVLVLIKKVHHVLEVCVHQEMVNGEVGHLGHLVEVIVGSQDPEVVIIQLLHMEGTLVLVLAKKVHHVLEVCVQVMVIDDYFGILTVLYILF